MTAVYTALPENIKRLRKLVSLHDPRSKCKVLRRIEKSANTYWDQTEEGLYWWNTAAQNIDVIKKVKATHPLSSLSDNKDWDRHYKYRFKVFDRWHKDYEIFLDIFGDNDIDVLYSVTRSLRNSKKAYHRRLRDYDKSHGTVSASQIGSSWQLMRVFYESGQACVYRKSQGCGCDRLALTKYDPIRIDYPKIKVAVFDHKVPLSKGGNNTIENIVVACNRCNLVKGDKDLIEPTYWRKNKSARGEGTRRSLDGPAKFNTKRVATSVPEQLSEVPLPLNLDLLATPLEEYHDMRKLYVEVYDSYMKTGDSETGHLVDKLSFIMNEIAPNGPQDLFDK